MLPAWVGCIFVKKTMIPARGPQTWVGVIIDDADDGAGDGDGSTGDVLP